MSKDKSKERELVSQLVGDRIVEIVSHREQLIVATSTRVYRLGNDDVLYPIEFLVPAPPNRFQ